MGDLRTYPTAEDSPRTNGSPPDGGMGSFELTKARGAQNGEWQVTSHV